MKINDVRHQKKGVLFDECLAGEAYVDVYGNYLLCPDMENTMVCLQHGTLYSKVDYNSSDEFFPVNARLEIE